MMMTLAQLKSRLASLHGSDGKPLYNGAIDNVPDAPTRAAIIAAMTIGADTSASALDYKTAADSLGVDVAKVRTIAGVESSGAAFVDGRPVVLFEGHRFSAATHGIYDKQYPTISYPVWNKSKYPTKQSDRYAQIAQAVCLNVDAGFASASYGKFQILGENYQRCGFISSWAFAWAMSQSEGDQLAAFVAFCKSDSVLLNALRATDWATVAKRYNGTAYRVNHYDTKLAAQYIIEKRNEI